MQTSRPPPGAGIRWSAVFALCWLAAAGASLAIGKDINWDLKNYHYYNAYSFVNGRLLWDIAPAQIQGFFNPIGDLPFYYLVKYVKWPPAIAVIMATWAAIGIFFLIRIALLFFPASLPGHRVCIGAAVAIGATGSTGLAMVASTMNEWQSTAFIMASLYVLLGTTPQPDGSALRGTALAGLLAGIAAGLKLTFGTFALGLLFASGVPTPGLSSARRFFVFGCSMLAGLMLSYGLWGAILLREFENPFYPLFNTWFKSPYFEPIDFLDRNYGPGNALQAILFPLLVNGNHRLTMELPFHDYRFAALYVLSIACLGKFLWRRSRHAPPSGLPAEFVVACRVTGVFALVGYLAWLKLFGIYRYTLALELAAGPLIVACMIYLLSNLKVRRSALVAVAALLILTTQISEWGRAKFGNEYFEVRTPELAPNALVVMGRWEPMSYIIPFFRPDARFVAPANLLIELGQTNAMARRAADVIASHSGPIYSMDFGIHQARTDRDLAYFHLARIRSACLPILSRIDDNAMQLCRVERRGQ